MSKKPIKSNLFRFITLRGPQTANEASKSIGFISFPTAKETQSKAHVAAKGASNEAEKREALNAENLAIIRMEQLYSFPYDELEMILKSYSNCDKFIWCQEEPANQGAWFSHRHRIQRVLDRFSEKQIQLISRPSASAPAVGLNKLHKKQQESLIDRVFED